MSTDGDLVATRSGAGLVLSVSYGNDSIALIQYTVDQGFTGARVAFIDTGWAGEGWMDRVCAAEAWATSMGMIVIRIRGEMSFEELIIHKKGFPNQRYQWCSGILKGLPFLNWIDEVDPDCKLTVVIGKRRAESRERKETPEFVDASEYHGGRRVWHPLYLHDDAKRDDLIRRAGFAPLPHRSMECAPCVNANRSDFVSLSARDQEKTAALEAKVGKTMFRPNRHGGAKGIEQVMMWARSPRGKYKAAVDAPSGCSSGYCGY